METRKSSLIGLREELVPRLKEHLASEDEILVCYETKREIKNSVDAPHTSFKVAIVTVSRLIWGELRLFKSLWGYNGKSDAFVKSWLLEEIGNVTEQTNRDSGFSVIIMQNGTVLALLLFALREMSVNFTNVLRDAIKQAKAKHTTASNTADRLRELQKLHDEKLIGTVEYQQKRKEILGQL